MAGRWQITDGGMKHQDCCISIKKFAFTGFLFAKVCFSGKTVLLIINTLSRKNKQNLQQKHLPWREITDGRWQMAVKTAAGNCILYYRYPPSAICEPKNTLK
jgi:hypothetical protein